MVAPMPFRRRVLGALGVAVVIGGAGGSAAALVEPVTYTATSQAYLSVQSASTVGDLDGEGVYEQRAVAAWAAVATTPLVLKSVVADLHLHTTVSALAARVHAHAQPDTVLIHIDATDQTSAGAARLANAVLDRLVVVAPSLMPTKGSSQPTDRLTPVQRAVAPTMPSGPSVFVLALAGALAGVLVWALILAVVQIRRRPPGAPGQPAPSML